MFVLAAILAVATSDLSVARAPTVAEAKFAPLPASERAYAAFGPAGPFYPARAAKARVSGEAIIECRRGSSGELKRCKVVSEDPIRHDFGVAAVMMAERKRIVGAADGSPGESVRVRVPFSLGAPVQVGP